MFWYSSTWFCFSNMKTNIFLFKPWYFIFMLANTFFVRVFQTIILFVPEVISCIEMGKTTFQMDIFSHFKFCHNRRNGFRLIEWQLKLRFIFCGMKYVPLWRQPIFCWIGICVWIFVRSRTTQEKKGLQSMLRGT